MRFSIPTKQARFQQKIDRLYKWHPWFAWKPVRLTTDNTQVRVFETILRQLSYHTERSGFFGMRMIYRWEYTDSILDLIKGDSKDCDREEC